MLFFSFLAGFLFYSFVGSPAILFELLFLALFLSVSVALAISAYRKLFSVGGV